MRSFAEFTLGHATQHLIGVGHSYCPNRPTGLDSMIRMLAMTDKVAPEILFYHLTRKRVEDVLPGLLETCLMRDWRVVVQASSAERVEALDALLWTYRDDSFLPHGSAKTGFPEHQPVYLTADNDNSNKAKVRFFVDSAAMQVEEIKELDRAILLFDAQDEQSLNNARQQWAEMKAAGFSPTYWQQNEKGKWEKRVV